ncbi:MAG: hypothetical protein HOW73_16395 [Polyangiaceae bacterium]|nr:hypothetical protein [Polyangiaceae bacterium]
MKLTRSLGYLAVLVSIFAVGCGDDETTPNGGSGGDAPGGQNAGGEGGAPTTEAAIKTVHAPDETTVVVELEGDFGEAPTSPNAFEITSLNGDLGVGDITYDEATKTITIVTAKQKLGVEYTLKILTPGSPLDLETAKFLSADTAKFWATDLMTGVDYEVVADRLYIGENGVFYATPDAVPDDTEAASEYLDTKIVPIETALLHEMPDKDKNGKILILGLDGHGQYGGYFNPINSLPNSLVEQSGLHSNEMEMLYVSVPDLGYSFGAEAVIAHEFSHLLYNENHDFFSEDWAWHNEGLAECAVHAVAGSNQYAADYYVNPFMAPLANGQSLVNWTYSNYSQYAQAYVFLTYAASRLGGISGYGEMFQLGGDPAEVGAFFQEQLGRNFSEMQLDMLTSVWLQQPTGQYGFDGMISFSDRPETATMSPLSLGPFTGVLFPGPGSAVAPVGAGPDVVFRGINAAGAIDDEVPFDADGGVLIALHATTPPDGDDQSTGTILEATAAPKLKNAMADRAWMHPPPIKPANRRLLLEWRKQAHGF